MEEKFIQLVRNKSVLFVTSKNLDYIRNTQEIELLKNYAKKCDIIGSKNKNYLIRIIYTYIKLVCTLFYKYDYIFFGFSPQLYFVFFPFIKKDKLIIDFFISMYDTFVDDRKKISKDSLMAKILHKIDEYVLKKASFVISDTKAHRNYFINEFNISLNKFIVLYLVADTSIYDLNKYPKKIKDNYFYVLYFGSILPLQGIEVILEAMKLLRDESEIKFIIIGPINDKFKINDDEYPNTQFISWLNQEDLAKRISQADLCLAGHFNKKIGKANRTIAGKTYIYEAMNKPIILGDSDANRELFKEDSMHYFVEMGDAFRLSQLILKISREIKDDTFN